MTPKKVLILGFSFSGKTYLTEYFRKYGENAFDAEFMEGIFHWVKKNPRRDAPWYERFTRMQMVFFKKWGTIFRSSGWSSSLDIPPQHQIINTPSLGSIDREWLKEHTCIIDESFLRLFLQKQNTNTYIFGMSANAFDLDCLFDKVYYLDISSDVIQKRFRDNDRPSTYMWGRSSEQQEIILKNLPDIKKKAREKELYFINADLPPSEIYHLLTGNKSTDHTLPRS